MATKFITVSIEIMHDKNLTANQKFILAEIEQLSELDKGCVAKNEHFSKLTGIAKESVSRCINDLEKKGYICIEIKNGSRNHIRVISINKTSSPALTKHQETKENIQDFPENQDLSGENNFIEEAFKELWKDYSLTFLKGKGNNIGSKANALKWYKKLIKFGASVEEIYKYCEHHAGMSFGHKYLENLLRVDLYKQYLEDVK